MATIKKVSKWFRTAMEIWGESLLAGSENSCAGRN